MIEQIITQSPKLIDVIEIADLNGRDHLEFEQLMAKLDVGIDVLPMFVACLRATRARRYSTSAPACARSDTPAMAPR